MIPLIEAYKILDTVIAKQARAFKTVKTVEALGRVVAAKQWSRVNLPAFNKATMDGYAILEDDIREQYKVLETIPAGKTPTQMLRPGCVSKVMTGAPIPEGTARVIPVEYAHETGGMVSFDANYPPKRNIAKLGEDVREGNVILERGTLITPITIANLIACGITEIAIYRKLRVAIISTGDEIVAEFSELTPGKIMNSNGPMLDVLCRKYNFKVLANITIKDDLAATTQQIRKLVEEHNHLDMILLSGGVSMGDFDFVERALTAAGFQVHFNSVAIKPGRPTTFASKGHTLVFALPGNPVAVYLTFHLFAVRAFWRKFGIATAHQALTLPLQADFQRRDTERMEFVPCYLDANSSVVPITSHGSAHLAALLKCDGFFVVERWVAQVQKGSNVLCFLLK